MMRLLSETKLSQNFDTDPVKDSFLTMGCVDKTLPTAGALSTEAVMILNIPLGNPALCPSSASASAERGVSGEGLQTTVHPEAKAAAAFRVSMAFGKFHGVIIPVTPTGSLVTISSRSERGGGITSP